MSKTLRKFRHVCANAMLLQVGHFDDWQFVGPVRDLYLKKILTFRRNVTRLVKF